MGKCRAPKEQQEAGVAGQKDSREKDFSREISNHEFQI
jgi:hypothetical protein